MTLIANNDLEVVATALPLFSNGYFVVSATQGFAANPGGSQGNLCLGGTLGRYLGQTGNSGADGNGIAAGVVCRGDECGGNGGCGHQGI